VTRFGLASAAVLAVLLAGTVAVFGQGASPGKIPIEGPVAVTTPQLQVLPFRAIGAMRPDGAKCTEGEGAQRQCVRGFGGVCTVSAIAPRVVLTAAHCLVDEQTGADRRTVRVPIDPQRRTLRVEMAMRADVVRGPDPVSLAAARVTRIIVPQDYLDMVEQTDEFGSSVATASDWGIAVLDADVVRPEQVLPIRPFTPQELDQRVARGQMVMQAGYGFTATALRWPHRMHVIRDCRIDRHWGARTYGHFCGTVPGDSGSPNLVEENGRFWIVGVESRDEKLMLVIGIVVAAAAFADAARQAIAETAR
jgi:hypothetical protein